MVGFRWGCLSPGVFQGFWIVKNPLPAAKPSRFHRRCPSDLRHRASAHRTAAARSTLRQQGAAGEPTAAAARIALVTWVQRGFVVCRLCAGEKKEEQERFECGIQSQEGFKKSWNG